MFTGLSLWNAALWRGKYIFFLRRVICSNVPICAPICWCWIAPQRPNVGKQDSLINTQGILGKHTGDNLDGYSLKGLSTKFIKCKTFKSKHCYVIRRNIYDWTTRGSQVLLFTIDKHVCILFGFTRLSHGSFSGIVSWHGKSIADNKYVTVYTTNIFRNMKFGEHINIHTVKFWEAQPYAVLE